MLGGYRGRSGGTFGASSEEYLLRSQADLSNLPDLPAGGRTADRYDVYWPSPELPASTNWTVGGEKGKFSFRRAMYDPHTGSVTFAEAGREPTGWIFIVAGGSPEEPLPALPTRCLPCGDNAEK